MRVRVIRIGRGLAILGLALPVAAAAHPGHGLAGGSHAWLHYLSDPLHVAPAALALLAFAVWRVRARVRAR